jgi:hypothetical protein
MTTLYAATGLLCALAALFHAFAVAERGLVSIAVNGHRLWSLFKKLNCCVAKLHHAPTSSFVLVILRTIGGCRVAHIERRLLPWAISQALGRATQSAASSQNCS